ncbi:hypothetical protein EV121DRAFT_277281 [Schizophyllum commune]
MSTLSVTRPGPLAPRTNLPQLLVNVATKRASSTVVKNAAADLSIFLPSLEGKLTHAVAATRKQPVLEKTTSHARPLAAPERLEPCYNWLASHLHNPYPTREEREALARECDRTVPAITAWFVAARQRIGWSQLRATRFGRSQILMVAAASRFWPERDTTRPLPPDLELRFAEVEANVKSFYTDSLQPSATLVRLLKSENRPPSAKEAPRRSASESNLSKKRRSEDADLDAHRPTKRRSVSNDSPKSKKVSSGRAARARPPAPSTSGLKKTTPSSASSLALTISPTQPPQPKFGEPSLQSTSPTSSLKRSRSADDASPDAKRRRVLPEWRDPRSPQNVARKGVRASEGPRSPASCRSISSQSPKDCHGRSHGGRRTVSAPVAPHIAPSAFIDELAWPSVLSLPTHATAQPEVTLPLPCNDNLDLWNLPPSSLDAGIPNLASNDISYNLPPSGEASDTFADVPSPFDPIVTSPTSSASSPPGSAPITPPKLTPQLTGDSTVDVGANPWGGLFGQSDFPYDSCVDPLAPSSSDIDFLTMLANDRPLCGDNYSLDDFCNPCSWWDSPVGILPGNDVAPVAAPAVAERPSKRALPTEDEYLALTPPKRRRLTPAAA